MTKFKTKEIGEVVKSYLEKYPKMKTRRLAIIISEIEGLDVEGLRSAIRYYRGSMGKYNRDKLSTDRYVREYNLPEPENEEYTPFVLDKQRLLILSDIHVPYHDNKAITAAIEWAKEHSPDSILLNGDILDCYQLSNFSRDPRKMSFVRELDQLKLFLETLNTEFPDTPIYYKLGNHEERIELTVINKTPDLVGVVDYSLKSVVGFNNFNCTEIKDKRIVQFSNLNILHGHEIFKGASMAVNPARTAYLRATENTIVGHTHKSSEHNEVTLNGKLITTWSAGCLCYMHPQYMPINKWNHGFAFVKMDNDNFRVTNLRIHEGRVL